MLLVSGLPSTPVQRDVHNHMSNVIEKARDIEGISRDTPCSFVPEREDHGEGELSGIAAGPGVGMDDDVSLEIIENTASSNVLKLWPWMNQVRSQNKSYWMKTHDTSCRHLSQLRHNFHWKLLCRCSSVWGEYECLIWCYNFAHIIAS